MVLNGKSSQENSVNAGVPQVSILGPTLFLFYVNDLPHNVIYDIAIYSYDTTLYSLLMIRSIKFLSPGVALSLYKSTIHPCMKYCCHVWAGAPSCYLELLDKVQKLICRTVGPSLAASLEPLAHRQNVASLSLFYTYYFRRWKMFI